MTQNTYIAATRFGLGMGPHEAQLTDATIMQWLWEQVQRPEPTPPEMANLPTAQQNAVRMFQARKSGNKAAVQEARRAMKEDFIDGMRLRMAHAVATTTPFYERLANFWNNHFTISVKKPILAGLALAYEREAIRPHVTGRFEDMLLAVAHHPAMLIYLDNAQSIGADSFTGMRQSKGINENLAREIMELHTLGVNGGYTQTDVTTFAKIITGWSIGQRPQDNSGGFFFAPRRHEPGTQTILGKQYPDNGEAQGIAVLRDLAAHPATAKHIATKLARHFISDDPPENAVKQIADAFLKSGGDFKTIYRTLLSLPEAWSVTTPKIKSSYDFVISTARLCTLPTNFNTAWYTNAMQFLGNMPFNAPSPAGWPDVVRDLAGPEAIMRRIEWAQGASAMLSPQPAKELAELAIGPIMSTTTRDTFARANNDSQRLALLLGSPEFQRR